MFVIIGRSKILIIYFMSESNDMSVDTFYTRSYT